MQETEFEAALASEWTRLVRLCAWLTGRAEAAEDLAQDTLVAAWRSREQLTALDKLKPWTSAIARNICLNWSRAQRREQTYTLSTNDSAEESLDAEVPDETDLELELDRHELATLLDRALSLLPPETGQMLVEHYIKESSHAEIAARMDLKPGTVAVRLQRGKLTLKHVLGTALRDESVAFGLIPDQPFDWVETNIWCINCGQVHLLGKFTRNEIFALRCPKCDPKPDTLMAGMDLTQPYYVNMLGSVRAFKPAYSRLLTALAPLYRRSLQGQETPCPACGLPLQMQVKQNEASSQASRTRQILLHCPGCSWVSNKTSSGLALSLPEALKFWRANPRIVILPEQELEAHGTRAFVTRIQSVTSAAELTVLSRSDTFEPLEVHSNIPL